MVGRCGDGDFNVPMFTALRRVTVVFVMVEEYYLLGAPGVGSRGVCRNG